MPAIELLEIRRVELEILIAENPKQEYLLNKSLQFTVKLIMRLKQGY